MNNEHSKIIVILTIMIALIITTFSILTKPNTIGDELCAIYGYEYESFNSSEVLCIKNEGGKKIVKSITDIANENEIPVYKEICHKYQEIYHKGEFSSSFEYNNKALGGVECIIIDKKNNITERISIDATYKKMGGK